LKELICAKIFFIILKGPKSPFCHSQATNITALQTAYSKLEGQILFKKELKPSVPKKGFGMDTF